MPNSKHYSAERHNVFSLIIDNLKRFRINSWELRGLDPLYLVERFKLSYGLTNGEQETLVTIFTNMLFSAECISI